MRRSVKGKIKLSFIMTFIGLSTLGSLFVGSNVNTHSNNVSTKVSNPVNEASFVVTYLDDSSVEQTITCSADADFNALCIPDGQTTVTLNGTTIDITKITSITLDYETGDWSNITTIGNNFLKGFTSLSKFSLSNMPKLTSIGTGFMDGCTSVTELEISNLPLLASAEFLSALQTCTSLTDITISQLPLVDQTSLKNGITNLSGLLTKIDISNMDGITSIADLFSSMTVLEDLSLSNLTNVNSLTSETFTSISSLQILKLANIGVTTFPENFLANSSLTSLTLGEFPTLASLPIGFLSNSTNLTSLNFQSDLTNITAIPNDFLTGCSSLSNVNVSILSNLTRIGNNFLKGCLSLNAFDISTISNLSSIGTGFLKDCTSLNSINFPTSLTNLSAIPDDFLVNCSSLIALDLSGFGNVTSIGTNFLSQCSLLSNIVFPTFSNLTLINDYFLSGCSDLRSIDFANFANIETIKGHFLDGCIGLTKLNFGPCTKLTLIGAKFLNNCSDLQTMDLMEKETPPTLTSWGDNLSDLTLITTNFNSYASATTWSEKAPLIKNNMVVVCSVTTGTVGQEVQVTATINNLDHATAPITWTADSTYIQISDPTSYSGVAKTIKLLKASSTPIVITATSGSYVRTISITINPATVTAITLKQYSFENVEIGSEITNIATINPEADPTTPIYWKVRQTSDAHAVNIVNSETTTGVAVRINILYRPKQGSGSVMFDVTSGAKKTSFVINIKYKDVESVQIEGTPTIKGNESTGGSQIYKAIVNPVGSDQSVEWSIETQDHPNWITINSSTGELKWSDAAVLGEYTFKIRATSTAFTQFFGEKLCTLIINTKPTPPAPSPSVNNSNWLVWIGVESIGILAIIIGVYFLASFFYKKHLRK